MGKEQKEYSVAWTYSLGKYIRSNVCSDILSYMHDIAIPTKDPFQYSMKWDWGVFLTFGYWLFYF